MNVSTIIRLFLILLTTVISVNADSLMASLRQDDIDTITELIKEDPRAVCAPTKLGNLPIHQAAFTGNTEALVELIKNGADVNAGNAEKWSPLHFAIWNNNLKSAQLLISEHAEIDAQTSDGKTPLHLAVYMNNPAAVQILLDNYANTEISDKDGKTPADMIVDTSYQIMDLLVGNGAKIPELIQKPSWSPVKWLTRRSPFSKEKAGLLKEIQVLEECLAESLAVQARLSSELKAEKLPKTEQILESADQTVKTEPEAIAPETAIEISESLADDPQIESDVTVASESLSDDPRSDAMNNLIKELEEKNRALTETLEKKQAELDIALNTNEQMTEQQSKLQWSAMNSEAQMRLLNITLEQVRKEKDALDTSIKNKKHPQYDSSETEASSARIKELEAQISRDQIELNRLEDKLALAEEEVTNLQRRLTQLTDQKATCQVLEKRIAELKKKLSDSEKRSELLLKQLRKTARERQDLELQLKGFSE
ncbi:MAG: hypothetical protein GX811_10610 [Lentisphaerae bacterium]|nr:hypothetical protein [Lentisphaerota bacterium]